MHASAKTLGATTDSAANGTYRPEPSVFRDWVRAEPGARFRAEAGRYHLYVMYGCPWAHRTLIMRTLKGLERAIGVTAVHYHLVKEEGWRFSPEEADPLYGLRYLRELYNIAVPSYGGRVTVPLLWDKHERTIVNNESAEIMRMFNSAFNAFATRPEIDLYPEPLRPTIDQWNERIYAAINVGAYAAAFARNQSAYEQAVLSFFEALDELEGHLGTHRYLAGTQPSEADWRLFPTLIRFEWVYHALFNCNLRRLVDYPNLYAYTRELYQWPGIAATVNEYHIRQGYFTSFLELNPTGFVPIGPRIDFKLPHGRG